MNYPTYPDQPQPQPDAKLPATDAGNRWALGDYPQDVTPGYTNDGQFILTIRQAGATLTLKLPPDKAIELGQAIMQAASAVPTASGLYLPPGALAPRPHGPAGQNGALQG